MIDVNILAPKNVRESCGKFWPKRGFSRLVAHPTSKGLGFQNPETNSI
jgi:hypothetical protein